MWPVARAIAKQLLTLGYGRRELHPPGLPLHDENLNSTRKSIQKLLAAGRFSAPRELRSLVKLFDSGPLTLQQLSRIAIRRAVGGQDFAARVRSTEFRARLPPALYCYVSDPTELMLSSAEVNGVLAQNPNSCCSIQWLANWFSFINFIIPLDYFIIPLDYLLKSTEISEIIDYHWLPYLRNKYSLLNFVRWNIFKDKQK